MSTNKDHRSVAQAFYQLNFYLETIGAPFSVKDLYHSAYAERRGERYQDEWIAHLEDDPNVRASLDEPFTAHTIIETLFKTGHEAIFRQLIKHIRKSQIGFTQLYIVGAENHRYEP